MIYDLRPKLRLESLKRRYGRAPPGRALHCNLFVRNLAKRISTAPDMYRDAHAKNSGLKISISTKNQNCNSRTTLNDYARKFSLISLMMKINSIKEYYELSEKGIQDQFAVSLILSDVGNKSTPQTALFFFIESELLNNCTYREFQFVFWSTIARYNFDRLGFPTSEDLNSAVVSYLKARLMVSKSPLLLAKYHHALWHSSTQDKHIHGRKAIENYIAHISSGLIKKTQKKNLEI